MDERRWAVHGPNCISSPQHEIGAPGGGLGVEVRLSRLVCPWRSSAASRLFDTRVSLGSCPNAGAISARSLDHSLAGKSCRTVGAIELLG